MMYAELLRRCRGHIVSFGYRTGSSSPASVPLFARGHGVLVDGRFAVCARSLHLSMPVGKGVRYYARFVPAPPAGGVGRRRIGRLMPIELVDSDEERDISVFRLIVPRRGEGELSYRRAFPTAAHASSAVAILSSLDLGGAESVASREGSAILSP